MSSEQSEHHPNQQDNDRSNAHASVGGIIHSYQRYDPAKFPSPTAPPPDLASMGMEHMMMYGSMREFTEEELANAIELDPSQFAGLGPSLESLIAMLEERKRKILETYETKAARKKAERAYDKQYRDTERAFHQQKLGNPKQAKKVRDALAKAYNEEQIRDLERLFYRLGDDTSEAAQQLMGLIGRLGDKYQVDELAFQYDFTGREKMNVQQALEIKEELEEIDRLLEQLKNAMENAQLAYIDMEALEQYAEPGDMNKLRELQQMVEDYLSDLAERQGLEKGKDGRYRLTPQAMRTFQGKLLGKIFSNLQASRTGRHEGNITGDGAVELQRTKPYEFGDSVSSMDIPQTMTNAMLRHIQLHPELHEKPTAERFAGMRLHQDDIEVHLTRNNPKCATCVIMDMSGSMRSGGQYIDCKRMALALDGLIRQEYPGDYLQFIEMYSFAKPRHISEIAELMPKIPTIRDPVVRLRADMSDPNISESRIPPHFTNIQHALQQARRLLATQDTPNKQIILITDGLPTAHFEAEELYLLYPPDPRTEQITLREAQLCSKEDITINMFLVPSWSQTEDDIAFAYRLAESTEGRVIFTAGKDLDRYVIWDYVNHTRTVIG